MRGRRTVRLVSRHPRLRLTALTSRQFKGRTAGSVVPGLGRGREIVFEDLSRSRSRSGRSSSSWRCRTASPPSTPSPLRKAGRLVVDLSADFRLRSAAVYKEFYGHDHPAPELLKEAVYALPEFHAEEIKKADLLASPGCYPHQHPPGLAPALKAGVVDPSTVVVSSASGVTGAGKKAGDPPPLRRGRRELPALRRAEAPAPLRDRAGDRPAGRERGADHLHPPPRPDGPGHPLHDHRHPGVGPWTPARPRPFTPIFYKTAPFVRVLDRETLPETRNVARTKRGRDRRPDRFPDGAVDRVFGRSTTSSREPPGRPLQAVNLRLGFPEEEGLL